MPLFKYYPSARIDVLSSLKVRFAPISTFNDPFESLPDSSVFDDPKLRASLEEDIVTSAAINEVFASIRQKRPLRNVISPAKDSFAKHYPVQTAKAKNSMLSLIKKAMSVYRVFSLSRIDPFSPTALLLWGHYTESHTGIVLEFDEKHPWVTDHEFGKSNGVDSGEVIYSEHRTKSALVTKDREHYLVKAKAWSYEDEFRLIRHHKLPSLDPSGVDSLAKFPASVLKSVTLGVGASNDTETTAKAIIAANPDLSHVKIRRAKLHLDEFRLEAIGG